MYTTDLLTVREAAEQRRSIRAYSPEPVAREDLDEILRVTSLAPSAFNLQPWRFVVVETPEVKDALAGAAFNQRQVRSAPAVIVLYTDMKDTLEHVDEVLHPGMDAVRRASAREGVLRPFAAKTEAEREAWGAEQGNIALGFLLLAAEAHGYQTSPMAGFDAEAVKRLLGLPAHVRIPAIVAIGRGAEEG
ncbi:MAG TPA: nitroreductase family protein, partial [Longimicrobium sp.]|nr:nitroreductase family protein [Longimicrobium sp.]